LSNTRVHVYRGLTVKTTATNRNTKHWNMPHAALYIMLGVPTAAGHPEQ